jgi:hypothetical protein
MTECALKTKDNPAPTKAITITRIASSIVRVVFRSEKSNPILGTAKKTDAAAWKTAIT